MEKRSIDGLRRRSTTDHNSGGKTLRLSGSANNTVRGASRVKREVFPANDAQKQADN